MRNRRKRTGLFLLVAATIVVVVLVAPREEEPVFETPAGKTAPALSEAIRAYGARDSGNELEQ
jgi:hypothetical protein